ncbi:hypothetical protein L6452_09290 [Arctium lappa]|uniref:Uncharacterized protein n=1 Tax=Arctium lappa TaxID=4217 RepID=A0ACB9DK46_ARCLA|nr:hypothetical protein L6452_09290 [Arctium lappa]
MHDWERDLHWEKTAEGSKVCAEEDTGEEGGCEKLEKPKTLTKSAKVARTGTRSTPERKPSPVKKAYVKSLKPKERYQ